MSIPPQKPNTADATTATADSMILTADRAPASSLCFQQPEEDVVFAFYTPVQPQCS